ncbi:hypothetical protein [Mycobacterium hubeiense]|uniref:hypothetical protein n=1 Tax=Mycobacterium hubeiense TaxID=1867256 RepID=UPI0011571B82|nr:hypothetical protein [Mycobacterium sp. QGD 101]
MNANCRLRATVHAIVISAVGLAAVVSAAPAGAESLPIREDFTVECADWEPNAFGITPQQCWLGHWNFFEPPDTVNVRFTASPNHCSDINAKISLDNTQEQVIRLGPGESTGVLQFTKRPFPGNQGVFITAEGIPGGCNTGSLSSFGGTVEIW